MLGFFRNQSKSAAHAIGYVTTGVLMIIWSALWYYFYLRPDPNPPRWQTFTCVGIILSGVAIMVIGFLFGTIGRGAKAADTTSGVAAAPPVVTPVAAPMVAGTPPAIPTAPIPATTTSL